MSRPPGSALLRAMMVGAVVLGSSPAMADAVADFYRGKQIRVIVRTTPGTD